MPDEITPEPEPTDEQNEAAAAELESTGYEPQPYAETEETP